MNAIQAPRHVMLIDANALAFIADWQRRYGTPCDYFAFCHQFAGYSAAHIDGVLAALVWERQIRRPRGPLGGQADIELAEPCR